MVLSMTGRANSSMAATPPDTNATKPTCKSVQLDLCEFLIWVTSLDTHQPRDHFVHV